jgi:hypothetical protein
MSRRSLSPFLLASAVGVLSLLAGPAAALAAVSPTDDGAAVAQAIMASPPQLTGAGWQQRPLNIDPSATATAFGTQPQATSFPTHGETFAILSSGNAWAADDPGGGYEVSGSGWDSDRGDSHDVTTLRLDVNVPSTANCLSVDFSFLSEEWPDYVNDYNDAFIAELDTNDWTASGTTVTAPHNFAFDADGDAITINSGGPAALTAAAAAGTTYNGATPRMTASTPITPGLHAIYLSISDNSDWTLDSAAFIDNLQLGTVADLAADCPAGAHPAPPRYEQPTGTTAPSATGPEGSVLRTSGSFAGVTAPLALSLAPDVGTLVDNGDGSWEWSMFAADDLHLTDITVSGLGLGASASFDAIATNVAPAVTLSDGNDVEVGEGAERTYSYAIADPGADTITSVVTSCGPGRKVAGSDTHTNTSGSFRCAFADGPAAALVTVQATDDDGGESAEASQFVTVRNVAPTVALAQDNPLTFDESRSERTYSYAISDPGADTVSAVVTSCGAAGAKVPDSDEHSDNGGSFRCVFEEGPAERTVSVRATDSDGATGAEDRQTVVVNDPPIAAEGVDVAGVETDASTRTVATFSDPTPYATAAEYAASIDWGDGSASSDGMVSKGAEGGFIVTGTHAYARFGDYDVTVRIADADNSSNAATTHSAAAIADAPIHVVGKSVTSPRAFSGAVATFSDDATPDGPASEFSATIDWGDGSPRSAGSVNRRDTGDGFWVSGSHTYASTGRYAATVVVTSDGGSTDTATANVLVYAFATASGGAFVISDSKAAPGSHVTFWGTNWQSANPFLSGVSNSGSFRGYADPPASLTSPACGDVWSGRTGGSADAPATVPSYMAVVVTNGAEKSGSMVAGYVTRLVVVQTDAGYGSSGTGKVVAELCAMSDVPSTPPSPPRR